MHPSSLSVCYEPKNYEMIQKDNIHNRVGWIFTVHQQMMTNNSNQSNQQDNM